MADTEMGRDLTLLLQRSRDGDREARNALFERVYPELRRIAANRMRRERAGHTLSATAVVHEAYMKLATYAPEVATNRLEFFKIAATVIRNVLCDHARKKGRLQRGGDAERVELNDDLHLTGFHDFSIIEVSAAMDALNAFDEEARQIFEVRVFANLSVEDTAECFNISAATVKRRFASAKTFLLKFMIQEATQ